MTTFRAMWSCRRIPGYSQALRRAGPYGGYLGSQYDPFITSCEPKFDREFNQDQVTYDPVPPYGEPKLPSFDSLPEITADRLDKRRSLLAQIDGQFARARGGSNGRRAGTFSAQGVRAAHVAPRHARPLHLSDEPGTVRDRYGTSLYGSCMLLARRLVEAGVTFITVNTESKGAGHWDSHEKNFSMLRDFNLPNLDQIYTALVEDLDQRRPAGYHVGRGDGRNGP